MRRFFIKKLFVGIILLLATGLNGADSPGLLEPERSSHHSLSKINAGTCTPPLSSNNDGLIIGGLDIAAYIYCTVMSNKMKELRSIFNTQGEQSLRTLTGHNRGTPLVAPVRYRLDNRPQAREEQSITPQEHRKHTSKMMDSLRSQMRWITGSCCAFIGVALCATGYKCLCTPR